MRKHFPKKTGKPQPRPRQAPKEAVPAGIVRLFGFHAASQAWLNPKREIRRLLLTTNGQKLMESALMRGKGLKRPAPQMVEVQAIEKLLPRGAVHQGILLEAADLPEVTLDDLLKEEVSPALLVVLDQVTDPHNVGAILRSAAAFGAQGVLMTDRHAAASTGTLAKSASGALEHVPLVRIPNLARALADLQKANYWCIGLDETGTNNLNDVKLPAKVALVLGAEGEGLRRLTRESCDEIARLPTGGAIGSLNVSNAAAVAMYEVKRQRKS